MIPIPIQIAITLIEVGYKVVMAYRALPEKAKERLRQAHADWMKKCQDLDVPMGGDGTGP